MKRRALVLCLGAIPFAALAQPDTRTPLERYRGDTYIALVGCRLTLRLANAREQLTEAPDEKDDWRGCIAEHRQKALALYEAAAKVMRKPAAREALKAYHVAYIGALQGIVPAESERQVAYFARQNAADVRLGELWARVELEQ